MEVGSIRFFRFEGKLNSGWTLVELLFVIILLGVLFVAIPGIDKKHLVGLESQREVQGLVDQLRLAQRRAILEGQSQYLTLDPIGNSYRIYTLQGSEEQFIWQDWFQEVDLVGINRSVSGLAETFYFTPEGRPVFGCTITLQDSRYEWRMIIAVASGKIRIERL